MDSVRTPVSRSIDRAVQRATKVSSEDDYFMSGALGKSPVQKHPATGLNGASKIPSGSATSYSFIDANDHVYDIRRSASIRRAIAESTAYDTSDDDYNDDDDDDDDEVLFHQDKARFNGTNKEDGHRGRGQGQEGQFRKAWRFCRQKFRRQIRPHHNGRYSVIENEKLLANGERDSEGKEKRDQLKVIGAYYEIPRESIEAKPGAPSAT